MEVADLCEKIKLDLKQLANADSVYARAYKELAGKKLDRDAWSKALTPVYRKLIDIETNGQMTTDETALLIDIDNLEDAVVRSK